MPQAFYVLGTLGVFAAIVFLSFGQFYFALSVAEASLFAFAVGYVISLLMQIRDHTAPLLRFATPTTEAARPATASAPGNADDAVVSWAKIQGRDYATYASGKVAIQDMAGRWMAFNSYEEMADYIK